MGVLSLFERHYLGVYNSILNQIRAKHHLALVKQIITKLKKFNAVILSCPFCFGKMEKTYQVLNQSIGSRSCHHLHANTTIIPNIRPTNPAITEFRN